MLEIRPSPSTTPARRVHASRLGVALLAALALGVSGCGGSGEPAAARAALQRYLTALDHGDAAGVCQAFTPATRDRLAEFAGERLRLRKRSCAAAITRVLSGAEGGRLRRQGRARILSIELHGDRAQARIDGFDAPAQLVRIAGVWRVDAAPSGERD